MPTRTSKLLDSKVVRFLLIYRTQLYVGWVVFIGLVTLLPGDKIPAIIDWNFLSLDKLIHFTLFLVLTFLGSIHFFSTTEKKISSTLVSFFLASVYGSTIESLQTLIPRRGFDYADLSANIAGALTGVILFLVYYRKIFGKVGR